MQNIKPNPMIKTTQQMTLENKWVRNVSNNAYLIPNRRKKKKAYITFDVEIKDR
jgi:hypothetical protein